MRWATLVVAVALAVGASSTARAAPSPTITVRGSTRVELEKMQRVPGGVMVTVRLVDSDLGEGIEGKDVSLSILRFGQVVFRATRRTSKKGSAQFLVPYRKGEYELKLGYTGDSLYTAAQPAQSMVDLSKEAIQLTLTAPPRMDVGGRPQPVIIAAKHHSPIPGLTITLRARRDGRVVWKRSGQTAPNGALRLQLAPRTLGGPGELLLEARSTATKDYNAARTSQRLFLVTSTRVTLALSRSKARQDVSVTARGEVTDATGPVSGGVVQIVGAGRRLATAGTGKDGRYSVSVSLRHVPLGHLALRARFVPRTAWRRASRSRKVLLVIEPPKPIPAWYFLVPAAATVLFLLGILAVRRKPWRAWRQRLHERKETRREARGGIELGKRRSLRSLFAVDLQSVNGTVLDLQDGVPLAGGTVYLRSPDGSREPLQCRTAADGTFAIQQVPDGTYNLLVTAPGWIPQSRLVTVPHRGELHGLMVRLLSVRRRVMDIYAGAVTPLLRDPELVRYWTPSETTDAVLQRLPEVKPALHVLTELTERTYYDPEVPDLDVLEDAEALANAAGDAAHRERKRQEEERARRDSVMEEPLE